MANRMNIMVARKNGERTFWTRIGTAFEGEKGWQLLFDALPIPDDRGQVKAFLFPPEERTQERPPQRQQSTADALDDDVPWSR